MGGSSRAKTQKGSLSTSGSVADEVLRLLWCRCESRDQGTGGPAPCAAPDLGEWVNPRRFESGTLALGALDPLTTPAAGGFVMRFAMLGVSHETNTFSSRATTYAHFERSGILRGDEIRRRYRESRATLAGFFDAGDRLGVEVVPLVFAITEPMGTITADAFDRIVGEMLERLRTGGPWDGVLLGQHGAACSSAIPTWTGRSRRGCGRSSGPTCRWDWPSTCTPTCRRAWSSAATVTVIYRTNPHLDARPRAEECAELVTCEPPGERSGRSRPWRRRPW